MIHNKRSQSETMGFVLIIIIVTLMVLTFLYFIFRSGPGTSTTSADMSYLLDAFNEYTTNCSFIPETPQYKTGSELVQECFSNEGELCVDGRTVCEVLNDTFKEVIGKTLDIGDNYQNKAYKITIKYFLKGSKEKNVTRFTTQEGNFANCSERYGGYSIVSASPGSLEVRLEVCKAKGGKAL
jgi:hypothetical protein